MPPTPAFGGMTQGSSFQFPVRAYTKEGTLVTQLPPVTWTSLDTSVATVDATGLVLARRYGRASITATIQSEGRAVVGSLGFDVVVQL